MDTSNKTPRVSVIWQHKTPHILHGPAHWMTSTVSKILQRYCKEMRGEMEDKFDDKMMIFKEQRTRN